MTDLTEEICLHAHDLADKGEPDEAYRLVSRLLTERPNDWRPLSVAAYIDSKCERFGIALNLLRRANELCPNKTELLNNLGLTALGCMDLDSAERDLKHALKIKPDNVAAINNLALVYINMGQPGLAIEYGKRGLAIEKPDTDAFETLGYAYLMLRQWDPGWRHFEGALYGKVRKPTSYHGEPYWSGQECETLAIAGEQGIGDEISFASVIPDAAKRAKNVIIECDSRLYKLFKRSFPHKVYGTRFVKGPRLVEENPDFHCLSGSLCQYFRLTDESYPGTPYLVADPQRRIQWRALFDSMGTKPKVGIAWTGGKHGTHRERRSLKLDDLLPILRQHADFVSLEYRDPSRHIAEFTDKHGIKIHHWPWAVEPAPGDYDATAALVAELDLVICAQTAVVHLAGALGKSCWAMIPSKPLWRYGMSGNNMPWYESVRLFRQKTSWAEVINRIAEELRHFSSADEASRRDRQAVTA